MPDGSAARSIKIVDFRERPEVVVKEYEKLRYVVIENVRTVQIVPKDFSESVVASQSGVILCESEIEHNLVKALEAAVTNQKYFKVSSSIAPEKLQQTLSPVELKLLKLISEGHTTKQISDIFFLSPKTIEDKRYQICRKLGLNGPNALLLFALNNKERL